jgi:hypothetical protein
VKLTAHFHVGLVLSLRMCGATCPVLIHSYGMVHNWLSTGMALPLFL